MLRRSAVLLLATAFLIPALVAAYISPGEPTGYVSDFAGILKAEDRASMEAKLESFEASTGNEIAVVTVTSLGGDTIENYAVELFEEWGIGKEREDNGVLMLVALEEREMRIEVGYGLEGALTDAQSYWIINNELKPAFQRGDYAAGINAGVDKVIAATQGEIIAEDSPEPQAFNFNFLIFGFVAFQWLLAILARSKSWWAGGVFGALGG
ncbi:MAG TPA: TPM domain-containing protein, partial [Candidatus Paceibacterota bacterium]|nr:TPM domain-containing protein [Candidatus Paceibacterota bacterium]